ncbi:hypothetical protein [Arthrobacter ginkgonis]
MTTPTAPAVDPDVDEIPTPAHLGEAGAALFRSAVDEYELSIPERAALAQACETVDTLAELEGAIREHGRILASGRPSPLLAEARQQRAILVRLLGLLDLRLDDGEDAATATSRAARKASRARWDKQRGKA